MSGIVWWIIILAIVAAVAAGGAVLVKAYASGTSPRDVFFKPRTEPRIGVTEYANVDGKRRLLLIRRDDVEHLIMTGGPVDVVIETGIGEAPKRATEALQPATAATVFTRTPRPFGQAGHSPASQSSAHQAGQQGGGQAGGAASDEDGVALKR